MEQHAGHHLHRPGRVAAATVYISPQTEAILGYTPEEWYADPGLWRKIVHPDDRDQQLDEEARPDSSSTYRMIAKDGRDGVDARPVPR